MKDAIINALFGDGGFVRVRSFLALGLGVSVVYFAATGKVDASLVKDAFLLAMGFYFGQRGNGNPPTGTT